MTAVPDGGLLLVDKPSGCTSHDVVGRVRWLLRTRRVGHAGTLDPMATGLLVLGLERSTKLLGRLALVTKSYAATVRLGAATTTDDADGELLPGHSRPTDALTPAEVDAGLAALTGTLEQRPSSVSAIKVDGVRAYTRARAGEPVQLAARPVQVTRFERLGPLIPVDGFVDVDVEVDCSTGTYVRALARDLGEALGVGGHLTRLRRTAVGPFDLGAAVRVWPDDAAPQRSSEPPADLVAAVQAAIVPAAAAARRAFAWREADAATAQALSYGRAIPAAGLPGTVAVLAGERLLALVEEDGALARPVLVFAAAG